MPKFKPQFQRLLFIDKEIRSGKYPNCTTLGKEWRRSTKTILRDIDYLKFQLDAPIEYDTTRRGYYYTEPNYKLPAIDMSESDLFAVCIAEKVLWQYENTPLYGRLVSAFDKIVQSLPDKVSQGASWIDTKISVLPDPVTRIDNDVWETVTQALRETKTLVILHMMPGFERPMRRKLDPYHMVNYKGEWYMVGHCHAKRTIRTFALSRIKAADMTQNVFPMPPDFDMKKIMGSHFGIIWGHRDYRVRIKFTADNAPYVRERQWHPTQAIKEYRDGSIVLSFKTNHLYEVKRWILSWGAGAKALGPKELVRDIKAELDSALDCYKRTAAHQ